MPLYRNPTFDRLPPGLAKVFAASSQQSFFALPQWYNLISRFCTPTGTEVLVYTDERPHSMTALLLQATIGERRRMLTSLANFYSVEHGLIGSVEGLESSL